MKLTPFEKHHYAELCSWFASLADVVQWGGPALNYPLDAAQLDSMVAESAGFRPNRNCWMPEDDAGNIVGHVQLAFDRKNGVARIERVAISPTRRGRGLAKGMVRLVLAEAFADPEIERVELNVYTWNTAAIRTYTTLGFVLEGVRRSSAKVEEERWDTAMMAVLRAEWQATSPECGCVSNDFAASVSTK
ncbi:GNAT family N-acetyltransferase [Rhizobium laguerreae]|uniref:GNAT family N-acetyltransferase n=1 Tax=Rhizobium laguerreae TaxID=1076926 RepID=UPI00143FB044|nr:GNAT family protein [Rhizobium laguerreae]NKM16123.1 GNAT family N-acetyltransferase [Rhizobium laguerreae]